MIYRTLERMAACAASAVALAAIGCGAHLDHKPVQPARVVTAHVTLQQLPEAR